VYNSYLKIKKVNTGKGVFTEVDIPSQSPILEISGDLFTGWADNVDYLQINNKNYKKLSGGIEDHIRHNCDPNCYVYAVGNRAIIYSLYVIKKGSEITFDYSTTSTERLDQWQMECKCNSYKCRKLISGFGTLSKELQEEYRKKGIVPLYITDNRFKGE